jgi:hypothetical protein
VGVTNMTIPQTRQPTVSAAPCPSWCDDDHGDDPHTHYSAICEWAKPAAGHGDDWRVEVRLYRGDDDSPWLPTAAIGDTVVELYLNGDYGMIDANEDDRPELSGYLLPDQIRSLAMWLLAMADEADPNHTNGEPSVRLPLLGLKQ